MSQNWRIFPALTDLPRADTCAGAWAGARATTLTDLWRALVPWSGPVPTTEALARLLEDRGYDPLFVEAFYDLPDALCLAEALLDANRDAPPVRFWQELRARFLALRLRLPARSARTTTGTSRTRSLCPGGFMIMSPASPRLPAAVSAPPALTHRVPPKSFAVYYGHQHLRKLSAYQTVVLQPLHYTPAEVQWLRQQGVRVLAYVSVGEDPSPQRSAWSRRTRNPEWGTWYVKIGHASWTAHLHTIADEYLHHFDGLMLDTLDGATMFPSDRSPLLRTLRGLRQRHPKAYFLANRGFELLPEMGQYVDGVLLESFTTSWTDGYRKLLPNELHYTGEMLRRVRLSKLDVYALDYACTPQQRRAAQTRARAQGVNTFISVRELNAI